MLPDVTQLNQIRDVSATSLTTLYCRAQASQAIDPILSDPQAVKLTEQLTPILAQSANPLHRQLVEGKIDPRLVIYVAMRARRHDLHVSEFIRRHANGVVVNLGCGLDTRYHRLDESMAYFYDLDFPDVIALKQQFFAESGSYRFIPASLTEQTWLDGLRPLADRPFLFVAEGVLMYLPERAVRQLVLTVQHHFPTCELVCEMFNAFWLRPPFKQLVNAKLRRALHFGKAATFQFGLRDGTEMESWGAGIRCLNQWSYMDEPEPKLGALRWLRYVPLFRKTQWTVHYRLSSSR